MTHAPCCNGRTAAAARVAAPFLLWQESQFAQSGTGRVGLIEQQLNVRGRSSTQHDGSQLYVT